MASKPRTASKRAIRRENSVPARQIIKRNKAIHPHSGHCKVSFWYCKLPIRPWRHNLSVIVFLVGNFRSMEVKGVVPQEIQLQEQLAEPVVVPKRSRKRSIIIFAVVSALNIALLALLAN